jgi:uncharacterized repeat protein (TIGR04042 family)
MPEVLLELEWPDGRRTRLYSPSTVILRHLPPGETLPVATLRSRALLALEEASERVRARYGFACTRTDEERVRLEATLAGYAPDALVTIAVAE